MLFCLDGFDISPLVKPEVPVTAIPARGKPPQCFAAPQWNERRSVKRDCSFIETQCPSSVFENVDDDVDDDESDFGVLPVSSRADKCRRAVSRIEELKADYIDSGDESDEPASPSAKLQNGNNTTTSPATTSTSPTTGARNPLRFQPRLLQKRRKGRQLGLESFLWSRPCT